MKTIKNLGKNIRKEFVQIFFVCPLSLCLYYILKKGQNLLSGPETKWYGMARIGMAKVCSPKEGGLILTDFGDKVGLSCIVARCSLEECFLVWPKHARGHANDGTMLESDLFF